MRAQLTSDRWLQWFCEGCQEHHGVPIEGANAWRWNGSTDNPTLHPSVLINRGRSNPTRHTCHMWITEGRVQFLGDCTHALAGKTTDIPEVTS